MTDLITSAANPLVKRIRALADRKHRGREGAFVVEGIQPVWRAVELGANVETLIVAPGLLGDSPANRLVEEQIAAGNQVATVSDDIFRRISDKDGPSGLAAIIRRSLDPIAALTVGKDDVFVALQDISNPGNLGTIIRTADSVGAAAVITVGSSTDPFAPNAVKASMGSLFNMTTATAKNLDEFFAWAAAQQVRVITTSARAATTHWTADWTGPIAILLGSEGDGLDAATIARGQTQVKIPMVGSASSLNLAVAAGVLLYEARKPSLS